MGGGGERFWWEVGVLDVLGPRQGSHREARPTKQ